MGGPDCVAEKEGFEPPVPSRVHRISSADHSTTLALLLVGRKVTWKFLAIPTSDPGQKRCNPLVADYLHPA